MGEVGVDLGGETVRTPGAGLVVERGSQARLNKALAGALDGSRAAPQRASDGGIGLTLIRQEENAGMGLDPGGRVAAVKQRLEVGNVSRRELDSVEFFHRPTVPHGHRFSKTLLLRY